MSIVDIFSFEDSDTAPVSYLLKQIYPSGSVLFANGNLNLYKMLKDVYNVIDFFVVFVDYVPNNRTTLAVYRDLLDQDLIINHDNILLVPVLCIEYYVLNMLKSDNVFNVNLNYQPLYDALVVDEDYLRAISMLNLSLEKLYKKLLSNQEQRCVHNVDKLGEYYKSDCKCQFYCDLLVSKKLIGKSFSLWRLLPVMDDVVSEDVLPAGCDFRHLSIDDVKLERRMFYNKVFDKFGRSCPNLYRD